MNLDNVLTQLAIQRLGELEMENLRLKAERLVMVAEREQRPQEDVKAKAAQAERFTGADEN